MKVAIGQFMQESHSFTPIACSWEQFRAGHIYRGGEIVSKVLGNRVELAGAIDFAAERRFDIARYWPAMLYLPDILRQTYSQTCWRRC